MLLSVSNDFSKVSKTINPCTDARNQLSLLPVLFLLLQQLQPGRAQSNNIDVFPPFGIRGKKSQGISLDYNKSERLGLSNTDLLRPLVTRSLCPSLA